MAEPKIRYDVLANAEGGEDVARLARELEKLDAAIDPAAAARAKALAQELEGLAAKRSAVVSFVTALANTNSASKALDEAGQALQRLERRLEGVATPSRKHAGDLEKLRDAAARAQVAYTAQTEALNRARTGLEAYGINASSVAGAQERLTESIKKTAGEAQGVVAGYRQTAAASQASAAAQATASRTVRDGISGISADFNKLQAVAGAALGGSLLAGVGREVAQVADEYANLSARIKIVTGDGAAFQTAFNGVFEIAKRTSSSLEETANLFTRIAQAGKTLGVSQQQALALTETINQAVQLSGASADSSKAAIIQLVQGLQSGVLRGEEFNSVMEQSPRLAQALADGLGTTTGELRKLAGQGALTTDVVIKALQGQSAALQREFAQLPPTVGRAIQNLSTEWTRYIGEADKANGTSATAAKAISLLANNLNEVGTALKVAGQAYLAYKAFDLAGLFLRQVAALQASSVALALESRERAAATVVTAANTAATAANTAAKAANATATTLGAAAEGKAAAAGAAGLGSRLAVLSRFAGVAGLAATGVALFGDLVVSSFKTAGTAIGEAAAKLAGYRDRSAELEALNRRDEESTRLAAQAKAEYAARAEAAANAALGLSTVAQGLVGEFNELRTKGDTASEALDKLTKKLDLGDAQGIKDASAALDALAQRGQIAGDQVSAALAKALNGKDLGIFEATARAAFDSTEQGARRLQAALDAIGSESLRRAGTSVRELTTGISEGFAAAVNDVDALSATLQKLGVKADQAEPLLAAALDKALEAAKTDKAIQEVIARLQAMGKEGRLSGLQVAEGLEAARKKADDLKSGINSVSEAYRLFGIKTKGELDLVAIKAKQAFDIINADPTATLAIKQQAFRQYAEAAVAANKGVADSTVKAQAQALGLGNAFDAAGKAITGAMDGASRATDAAGDAAKRYADLLESINPRLVSGSGLGGIGPTQAEREKSNASLPPLAASGPGGYQLPQPSGPGPWTFVPDQRETSGVPPSYALRGEYTQSSSLRSSGYGVTGVGYWVTSAPVVDPRAHPTFGRGGFGVAAPAFGGLPAPNPSPAPTPSIAPPAPTPSAAGVTVNATIGGRSIILDGLRDQSAANRVVAALEEAYRVGAGV